MRTYIFFLIRPKFMFFSPNVGGIVVDHLFFRFLISQCIPEIFAIKVKSCPKSTLILDVFVLTNF